MRLSAHSDNKQKSFVSKKKIGMLVFETLKTKNLIFWIVTRASARDYTVVVEIQNFASF